MNKVILVTGGSRGLGARLVERFAQSEHTSVYFTYLNSQESAQRIAGKYKNTQALKCDQRDEEQAKACVKRIWQETSRLDVLINNACPGFRPIELLNTNWESFHELLDANVKGAYFFTREASNIMKDTGGGSIINILSSYVLNVPPEKLSFYVTAKYALMGLSKAAAAELAKYRITVNMVSPGLMETDMTAFLPKKYLEAYSYKHPMKRMTTMDDTAGVVEFLASSGSSFLSGVNIPVNGGEAY